ncbi:cell division protein FtsZ [Candidatus Parcubacteria bacterium]|nr:cell division protein FtsZ [Candidatus Parcubacteria bacterium]
MKNKGVSEKIAVKKEKFGPVKTRIKVVGVGGAGCNVITRMMKCNIRGIDLIAVNTDAQSLNKAKANLKLQIGKEVTKGLGSGMNPEIGRLSVEESKDKIIEVLKNSDMVFIAYGSGGGTGTGGGPIIAEIAKNLGALTIAVATKPFSFEGKQRNAIAQKGLDNLKEKVDALITISNDKLFSILEPDVSLTNAFWVCDEILRQAVQGISDLIVLPGIINVDFADVKTIMKDSGTALFGIGVARGEKRAEKAAIAALNSSLLDESCRGAKGVLFNVSGQDISLSEINEVAKIITQEITPETRVIFGAIQNEKLNKGEIKVTIIATGF